MHQSEKLAGVASPLTFAPEERIQQELHCPVGSLGPGLNILTYIDRMLQRSDFGCGANGKVIIISMLIGLVILPKVKL